MLPRSKQQLMCSLAVESTVGLEEKPLHDQEFALWSASKRAIEMANAV